MVSTATTYNALTRRPTYSCKNKGRSGSVRSATMLLPLTNWPLTSKATVGKFSETKTD